jgi:3-methyladenine DNA glycosylase/8-oxoguanine DNA glycosylase
MTPKKLREAEKFLKKSDPIFKKHVTKYGKCDLKIDKKSSPYEALARSIVFQQLAGKAAQAIHNRFIALFGTDHPTPEELVKKTVDELRPAGLSRAKATALLDLAAKTLEGVVPTREECKKLSDDEIIARCVQVRGIGPWTVEMFLIFYLGRMDIFPATDYGVQKGFAQLYKKRKLPKPKLFKKHSERWKPYRSIAAWYFWRVLD